jgi:hypothetical protein
LEAAEGAEVSQKVQIELTGDEALVLFDLLSRYSDSESLVIEDQAEQRALWNLFGVLEKQLAEPLRLEYVELLQRARERLRDKPA